MKAVVAPVLLALAAASVAAAGFYAARHPLTALDRRTATTTDEGPFPKMLRSGARVQALPRPPIRIASLTVTTNEILARLVTPDRLAAVSRFARDPAISTCADRIPAGIPEIAGLDPERIIALGPDVVFVASYTQESALRILGAATIPVVRLRPVHSFSDVFANVRLVGAVTGDEAGAAALVQDAEERLRRVRERVAGQPRPRVLYLSGDDYTTGARTLLDEKIRRAGGENAAAEAGLVGDVSTALDLLVALDPDVVVLSRWSEDAVTPLRAFESTPAWRSSRAVRLQRVHVLAASILTSESEDAVLGVEALSRVLHPGASAS